MSVISKRGGAFAVKVGILPPLGLAGSHQSREITFLTTLDRNAAIRAKGLIFVERVAIEDFEEKFKARFDLEIVLAENSEGTEIENRIWGYV